MDLKAQMKTGEKEAEEFLKRLGYRDICYEPTSNAWPDFAVNGSIAVEVRLLNPLKEVEGKLIEVGEDFAIQGLVKSVCDEMGNSDGERSWFVICGHQRKWATSKTNKKYIRSFLKFVREKNLDQATHETQSGLTLTITRAPVSFPKLFRYGGISDIDQCLWVVPSMIQSISHFMKEKASRINVASTQYKTHWLLFIDCICLTDLERTEVEEIQRLVAVIPPWTLVGIINPAYSDGGFFLKS